MQKRFAFSKYFLIGLARKMFLGIFMRRIFKERLKIHLWHI